MQQYSPPYRGTIASANLVNLPRGALTGGGEDVPDVRVADSPAIIALFEGNMLQRLLEAGKLSAWARPMASGEPPLAPLPERLWSCHNVEFYLREDTHRWRNQTFIRTNARLETVYYDIHLDARQIDQVWPGLLRAEIRGEAGL
jgi:hypothetical protein